MRRFGAVALLLILAATTYAADPPVEPIILLPIAPPAPQPTPGVATKLGKGMRYVIACKAACDVVAFPDTLLVIEEKKGPRDWTAIFAGGTGDYEDRTFTYPFLYALKANGVGQCQVVIIPRGYKDKSEWMKVTLDVDSGVGPQPPPGPGPKPPEPPPTPDPLTLSFQAAYALDTDPAKAAKIGPLAELLEAIIAAAKESGSIQTLSQLQAKIHEADDRVAGKGGLPVLRKTMSNYVAARFPKEDQPMTEALWITAATTYAEIARALAKVVK